METVLTFPHRLAQAQDPTTPLVLLADVCPACMRNNTAAAAAVQRGCDYRRRERAVCCCCCFSCVYVSHCKLLTRWWPWYNSSRTLNASFCDGNTLWYFVVRVCVCVRTSLNTRLTIPTHPSSEFEKNPRNTAAVQQHQQQLYITSEPHIGAYACHRNAQVHLFHLATPSGFHIDHMPKGNHEHWYEFKLRTYVNTSIFTFRFQTVLVFVRRI